MSASIVNVKVFDMNDVLVNPQILNSLRELSLGPYAGMQTQLNRFMDLSKERPVAARAVMGYYGEDAVGWALFSKEETKRHAYYEPAQGILIYMFVKPELRRMGIGSTILRECRKMAGEEKLCVCPWDEVSSQFYHKNKTHKLFNALPYKQNDLGEDYGTYSY